MGLVWIPAISIYFDDPDSHSLEFIGVLPGKYAPKKEKLVISNNEWLEIKEA